MHNAWRVLTRDFRRILKAPKVWAIVIGLLIVPALYAWVNIVAFWDPYSSTEDIAVSVVNQDKGTYNEMVGELNVGDQVVAQLKNNHDIGWQFQDEKAAMHSLKSGETYAAIVIPAEFSEHLLTIMTPNFVQPDVLYYTNEKANAIAPKITDAAATAVDAQINSTFVSTVTKTVVQDLEQAGVTTGEQLIEAKNKTQQDLEAAIADVQLARSGLTDIEQSLWSAGLALNDSKDALLEVKSTIGDVQTSIAQAGELADEVQRELAHFVEAVTTAYVDGAAQLAEASTKLTGMVVNITEGAQKANIAVGIAIADVTAVVDANEKIIGELQDLIAELEAIDPADPMIAKLEKSIDKLQSRVAKDQQLLQDLNGFNDDISKVITGIQAAAEDINTAVQDSTQSASSIRKALSDSVPDITQAMSTLSASMGAFSSALDGQEVLVGEAAQLLTNLADQLVETTSALQSLDNSLGLMEEGLDSLLTDVNALTAADIWSQMSILTDLNPEQVSTFMATPVKVQEHDIFPVPTYGSAMAPLFTNLALWIGAFMLVVLIRQEVDTQGIKGLTVRQAYLGRFMLVAILNVIQAIIVSVGNALIGVQLVNPLVFVLTSMFIGFVYMAIIFALAASFGYIGKGVAVILVMMQIPGASGIYPIQLMPEFFQNLYPFFPFSHGIDAMREIIGGFYDGYYWRAMGILVIYAVLAFLLGIFMRQRLGNFGRLFNQKLSDTGLFASEDVQILGSRRRLTQLVQALADRQKFREKTAEDARWFEKHNLTLLRLALLIGLVVTVILLGFALVFPDAKAAILGWWGVLLLVVMGFIVSLEYIKQNIIFAGKLGQMPEDELRKRLAHEEAAIHSAASLEELNEGAQK